LNTPRLTRHERITGGLIGLLVGDALGVPYEFTPPHNLPPADQIEMTPPPGFRRAHVGVPPGTWSDDGAQALVLLDSLLANEGLDLEHFAHGLTRWLHQGFFAVNNSVFDIGAQTSTAINRLMQGMPADRSGPAEESRNGNGSLMRVLPLVLWHRGTDDELVALAARQSLPTHGHPRSQVACALYCLWARRVLEGHAAPWDAAAESLRRTGDLFPAAEIDQVLEPGNRERAQGSGYVLDCLWSARVAVENTATYEDGVRRAIAFGNDTDTTAAVAGGIAGLMYGREAIPERWQTALRGQSMLTPLLSSLIHAQP
jgi:ADP-ribosylglycohydrolase